MPLEKCVWTEEDFERMGWHDAAIHAMAVDWDVVRLDDTWRGADVMFDIDYIVEWIHPGEPGGSFDFEIAPATLVFEDAWDLEGSLNSADVMDAPEILDLHREAPGPSDNGLWTWRFDGDRFEISLRARRLRQHFRRRPIRVGSQQLTRAQRGGVSFDRPLSFPGEARLS